MLDILFCCVPTCLFEISGRLPCAHIPASLFLNSNLIFIGLCVMCKRVGGRDREEEKVSVGMGRDRPCQRRPLLSFNYSKLPVH